MGLFVWDGRECRGAGADAGRRSLGAGRAPPPPWPQQEGWHFYCERGCTRDDHGKAGPFSVERLQNAPAFCERSCVQTSTQRSAGPLAAAERSATGSTPPTPHSRSLGCGCAAVAVSASRPSPERTAPCLSPARRRSCSAPGCQRQAQRRGRPVCRAGRWRLITERSARRRGEGLPSWYCACFARCALDLGIKLGAGAGTGRPRPRPRLLSVSSSSTASGRGSSAD